MTARMERFTLTLRELRQAIEPKLHLISPLARQEWKTFQGDWPSDSELREGVIGLTEGHLEALTAKARRFAAIVHGLALNVTSAPPPSLDEEVALPGARSEGEP